MIRNIQKLIKEVDSRHYSNEIIARAKGAYKLPSTFKEFRTYISIQINK